MNILYYQPNGKITRFVSGSGPYPVNGELWMECEWSDALRHSYVSSEGVAVPMPPRPSDFYDFDYDTKQWVLNAPRAAEEVRYRRNKLLADCDWTQLPDMPVAAKEAWSAYRQALRDITEQPGFPENVVWPQPPG